MSPDHTGNAGLTWQQRKHGVVDVLLLQRRLLLTARLALHPLAIQQSHGDVAVGVLAAQRGQRRECAGCGNVVLVATVVVLLSQLRVVRVVEGGGAQLGMAVAMAVEVAAAIEIAETVCSSPNGPCSLTSSTCSCDSLGSGRLKGISYCSCFQNLELSLLLSGPGHLMTVSSLIVCLRASTSW